MSCGRTPRRSTGIAASLLTPPSLSCLSHQRLRRRAMPSLPSLTLEPHLTLEGKMSLETLHEMLTYRRPASSKTEEQFIERYIRPLGVATDGAGNLHKRIGNADILWSCHTDTVHR